MSQAPQFVLPSAVDSRSDEPPHWKTASFRSRIAASIFDSVVVIGLGFVATIPVWQLSDAAGPFSDEAGWFATTTAQSTSGDLLISALEYAIITVVWLAYLVFLPLRDGREHGQTLGMRALGIRFVMTDGSPLTSRASWRRALVFSIISALGIVGPLFDALLGTPPTFSNGADVISFFAFAVLLVLGLRDDTRRLLYDRFAGTTVVEAVPGGRLDDDPDHHVAPGAVRSGFPYGPTAPAFPVRDRPRTAATWILLVITLLAFGATAVGTLFSSS